MPIPFLRQTAIVTLLLLETLPGAAQDKKLDYVAETWPWKPPQGAVYPGKDWEKLKSPEMAGFRSAKLEALRTWLKTGNTTGMMVVVGGFVLFEYGDVAHVTKTASVRKSLLGMLMGNYVVNGKIDLHKTVKQIGLDDMWPFLPIEESATLTD